MEKAPESTGEGLSRWTPSLPTNIISMINPFGSGENGNTESTNSKATATTSHSKKPSIFASIFPTASTPTADPEPPPSPSKDDDSIMFAEPETRSTSDEGSREGSFDDGGRRRSKRYNKPKTCYSICHPPPTSTTRQRLHRRPRSLLQLHKLCASARPQPAFEVVPSANFSVRLTKAITRVFKTKHGLCPNDLVVLKAEKYSTDELSEEQEARDIIALICKGRKEDGVATGKARICLPEGKEWEAYPMSTGGYEFFCADEHGLGQTARWVPKKNKDGSKPKEAEKRRFNFSTISPNSRRHPVIATLAKSGLEINDTYKMPDASVTPLSTPRQTSTILEDAMMEEGNGKETYETDDDLRQLILLTGIWVTFKEGWSPNFKYDDSKDKDCGVQRSPSVQHSPSKSGTFSPIQTPPGSPGPMSPLEKRSSIKSVGSGMGIFRRSSLLSNGRNRGSTVSVPEEDVGEELAAQLDKVKKTGRARADSNSTVLVHRAASNRAKNNTATWRPDLLTSQPEISTEDLAPRKSSTVSPRSKSVLSPAPTREEEANRRASAPQQKRESSNSTTSSSTTATSTASEVAPTRLKPKVMSAAPEPPRRRKRTAWRRLLCGGGNDI